MKIFSRIFAAIVLASISFSTSAFNVDTDKYFAYLEKPGSYHKGVTSPGILMLLSKQKCSAKGAPKSAKIGAIVYLSRGGFVGETPACWYNEELRGDDIVVLCTTIGNEMDGGSASCQFVSPSRFMDVSSLPRSADFAMPAEPTGKARELVDRFFASNTKCRSSPDAYQACDQRKATMGELRKLGWCWGPEDAAGYEKHWVRCQ